MWVEEFSTCMSGPPVQNPASKEKVLKGSLLAILKIIGMWVWGRPITKGRNLSDKLQSGEGKC